MPDEQDADLRQGAKAAAAAAAVGAAVGVARAIATRAETAAQRHGDDDPEETEASHGDDDALEQPPKQEQEPEHEERELEREPARGAAVSEIRRLTAQARGILHELSGVDVESVSAVERVDGGWRITLEAVEVRRVPDSTDVLATYAVDLDGDGDLVRYQRRRRYARSQSEGGGR